MDCSAGKGGGTHQAYDMICTNSLVMVVIAEARESGSSEAYYIVLV